MKDDSWVARPGLVKNGYLESDGNTRGTRYFFPGEPSTRMLPFMATPSATANSPVTGGNPPVTGKNPSAKTSELQIKERNSLLKDDSSLLKGDSSLLTSQNPLLTGPNPPVTAANSPITGENPLITAANPLITGANPLIAAGIPPITSADNPPEQDPHLLSLAAPAREKRRISPSKMTGLILKLCSEDWRSPQTLSCLLSRDLSTLRLWSLKERGLLEARYPEKQSHPAQQYRTSPAGLKWLSDAQKKQS